MSIDVSKKYIQLVGNIEMSDDFRIALLDTERHCKEFFRYFYRKNHRLIDDLFDYKQYRIQLENITYGQFVARCNENVKSALEQTFFQRLSNADMEKILNAIDYGKITLEQLYVNFKNNPRKNIMRYVL